jgi:hypothetical protein
MVINLVVGLFQHQGPKVLCFRKVAAHPEFPAGFILKKLAGLVKA